MESQEEFFDIEKQQGETEEVLEEFKRSDSLSFQAHTLTYNRKKKLQSEFNEIKLLQQTNIQEEPAADWVASPSPSGEFIAIGNSLGAIYVYSVSSATDRLLDTEPIFSLRNHVDTVTSISWDSESQLLMTSSADTTVHLYEALTGNLITIFKHASSVTGVAGCPLNPNYLVTGCLDKIIRLYKISEEKIDAHYKSDERVQTLVFSDSGNHLAVGLDRGEVDIYGSRRTDCKLIKIATLYCRNCKGIFSRGKKVVGLSFMDEENILVTTQDSRIRLYEFKQKEYLQKYKGTKILKLNMRGVFSSDKAHVICGSENGKFYIWNTFVQNQSKSTEKNACYESFRVSKRNVAQYAWFLPEAVRQIYMTRVEIEETEVKGLILTINENAFLQVLAV